MPKPRRVDRPVEKSINIPESIAAKVDLRLYSILEGKVPHGAWSKYINSLIELDMTKFEHEQTSSRKFIERAGQ